MSGPITPLGKAMQDAAKRCLSVCGDDLQIHWKLHPDGLQLIGYTETKTAKYILTWDQIETTYDLNIPMQVDEKKLLAKLGRLI